jgi:hypothetical protein
MITVDLSHITKEFKFPDNYNSIYFGFPPKCFYIGKGLGFGMTWVGLSEYKPEYLAKAIRRWKHNLRKQLSKYEYWQVTTRTLLFYGNEEETQAVDMHMKYSHENVDWKNVWSNILPERGE